MKVYWRTFVYNANVDNDRLKRAYLEFGYIDDEPQPDGTTGRFEDNVFLQTKNGPLDFQGREPIHPMFGRMENTNQALELQITQEYTGQDKMLTYLAPMWEEALKTDTYVTDKAGRAARRSACVGNIVDGTAQGHSDTAIVGVANLGNDDNLTGHHFSQANLYAFARQAWDWTLDSEDIADDWVRMTWSNDASVVDTIVKMMMGSREALVSYQTPLGVAHQFTSNTTTAPTRPSGSPRTTSARCTTTRPTAPAWASTAPPPAATSSPSTSRRSQQRYGNINTTPENLLGWFHHVPWDHRMSSGRSFWDELVYRYQMGVQYVTWMRETWDSLQPRHRRPPVRGGEGQAGDPRGRRGQLARHPHQLLAGVQRPGDPRRRRPAVGQDRGEREADRRLQPVRGVLHHPRGRRRVADDHEGHAGRSRRDATRSSPRRRAFPGRPSSRSRRTTSSARS